MKKPAKDKLTPEDEALFRKFAHSAAKKDLKKRRRHLSKMLTAGGVGPADRQKYGRLLRKGGPKLEAFHAELVARVEKPVEDESPGEPATDPGRAGSRPGKPVEDIEDAPVEDEAPGADDFAVHAEEVMAATADHLGALVEQFEGIGEGLVRELEEIRESVEEGESDG